MLMKLTPGHNVLKHAAVDSVKRFVNVWNKIQPEVSTILARVHLKSSKNATNKNVQVQKSHSRNPFDQCYADYKTLILQFFHIWALKVF